MKHYDSYRIRCGEQKLESELEQKLISILMEFGEDIDFQGCDDGDYDTAMDALLKLIKEQKS